MNTDVHRARKRPDDHLLDEAAEWIGRLRAADVPSQDRQAFAHWLDRSPAHRAAFDTMADLFDGLGVVASAAGARQLTAARAHNAANRGRPLMAVAAVMCMGVALALIQVGDDGLEHTTHHGETLAVRLPDGSLLKLNTDTTTEFRESDDARRLLLGLGGEVFVEVAPDAARPFTVVTDHGSLTAVGTAFGVHAVPARTRLSVVEGTVEVAADAAVEAMATRRQVHAGQGIDITAGMPVAQPLPLAASVMSWRDGRLIYDDVLLSDLVEDLNRYLPRRMTISDPALARTRVSAVLQISDQDAMLEALSQVLPLGWVHISETVVVIHPA